MSYPYPPRAEIGRAMVDEAFAEAALARAAAATLHPDEQAELDALVDALNRQHRAPDRTAVGNFLASLGDLTYQEAVANCEADKASYGWSHETSGAIREGISAHFSRAAPESTEALDAYDELCRATFCMQCGDQTDAKEGSLCTPCALQGMDDMDDHERAHAAGRV